MNFSFMGAFALWLLGIPAYACAHSLPYGVALSWADANTSALPLIVTNRGLVFADGQGTSYAIRCNEAYGANTSDRPLAYLEANGALTVGVYNRAFQTVDRGCTTTPSSGLPALPLSSLVSAPAAPQRMYVASLAVKERAGVFVSEDHGRTFSQVYTSAVDAYHETMVVAPSDSLRLYALGYRFDRANSKVTFVLSASLDGGKSWEDTVTDAKVTPLAVHPSKPDVLFAYRPTDKYETNFDILRSEDRGKNFKLVLANVYLPTGFAAVGDTLYLGMSVAAGLYQSHDDGLSFAPLLPDQIQRITCLAEHAGKLWLCANIAPNLDAIWTLNAEASGVDKVMSFDAVAAPVACTDAAASALCTTAWHDFDIEVHPPPDDAGVDAGALVDAGVGDAGDAQEDAGQEQEDETLEPTEDETDSDEAEPEDGGVEVKAKSHARCQFGVPGRSGDTAWALFGLALFAFARSRSQKASARRGRV